MSIIVNTRYLYSVCIAMLCAMPTLSFAQTAGVVIFKSGNPTISHSNEQPTPISKDDHVNAGDTIDTQNGRVQLSFIDGGKVSLQPNTVYKINRYEYSGNEDGNEYAFTKLIKGGLRTISGLIGHKNHERYQLETPVATIGIRGTEFTAIYTNKLIVTTNQGSVDVCNQGGCRNLVTGQSVTTSDNNTKPELTNEVAKVTSAPPSTSKPVFVQAEQLNQDRLSEVASELPNLTIDSTETFVGPTTNSTRNDLLITAIGKQSIGYLNYALVDGTMGSNENNNLTRYEQDDIEIKIISANINDFYSDAYLTMGRGKGRINDTNLETLSYIAGGLTQTSGLSQLANLNTTFNYSVIASTSSVITNASGTTISVGSPNSVTGNMAMNFATNQYSFNLDVPINGLNYNIADSSNLISGSANFASNALITVSDSHGNIACASGCNGILKDANGNAASVVGGLIGSQAERAGLQYGFTDISNTNALSGSVVLGR